MSTGALVFMLSAWAVVLGLAGWCIWRLLQAPPSSTPPPGTSL
jgi:hypothetical protein